MPRLGDIVGGLLAEIARGRMLADTFTRDLLASYGEDEVLASFTVPRSVVSEAKLRIRYRVDGITEGEAEDLPAGELANQWRDVVTGRVIPQVLDRMGITREARTSALATLLDIEPDETDVPEPATRPSRRTAEATSRPSFERILGSSFPEVIPSHELEADVVVRTARGGGLSVSVGNMRNALSGDQSSLVEELEEQLLDRWDQLPRDLRGELGGKGSFKKELQNELDRQLSDFVLGAVRLRDVRTALRSRIEISLAGIDESTDGAGENAQEIELTLSAGDIDTVVLADGSSIKP